MHVKLEIKVMMNVISPFALTGYELEEKDVFWTEADEVLESVHRDEKVAIEADARRHVGKGKMVMRRCGEY
ncbi:hypothetical protein SK128_006514, partial [Halocaridina rubra]